LPADLPSGLHLRRRLGTDIAGGLHLRSRAAALTLLKRYGLAAHGSGRLHLRLRLLPLALLALVGSTQSHRGIIPGDIGGKPVLNHLMEWDHICPTPLHVESVSGLVQRAAIGHVSRILYPGIKIVPSPFQCLRGRRDWMRVLVLPPAHQHVANWAGWLRLGLLLLPLLVN
jgi:hypothetical protein